MMNKEQCLEKIESMVTDVDFPVSILKECQRLIVSGGINLEDYEDDYGLPKIVLMVALKNIAEQYEPQIFKWWLKK